MKFEIFLTAEVKTNGTWHKNERPIFRNFYKEDGNDKRDFIETPRIERNFVLYALLSGNVNKNNLLPLNSHDGIPEDSHKEWQEFWKTKGNLLRHPSSVNLEDFDNYQWNSRFIENDTISLDDYYSLQGTFQKPFRTYNIPRKTNDIVIINQREADHILRAGFRDHKHLEGKSILVDYYWITEYGDLLNKLSETLIEPLRTLKRDHQDARVLFGFIIA